MVLHSACFRGGDNFGNAGVLWPPYPSGSLHMSWWCPGGQRSCMVPEERGPGRLRWAQGAQGAGPQHTISFAGPGICLNISTAPASRGVQSFGTARGGREPSQALGQGPRSVGECGVGTWPCPPVTVCLLHSHLSQGPITTWLEEQHPQYQCPFLVVTPAASPGDLVPRLQRDRAVLP